MNSTRPYQSLFLRAAPHRLVRGAVLFAATCLLSVSLPAQNTAPAGDNAGRRGRGPGQDGGGRGNFDPAQMQDRMMNYLREQFGVTDDSEWSVIAERITKLVELRRAAPASGIALALAGRGGPGGDGGRGRGGRGGSVSPEHDALRAALVDKLPDAEVKARLARLREVRAQTAGKLEKAQEDLRAVLTTRQEAMAVMAGLLP